MMNLSPPGFDYETLITDEDRELRKLALKHYSESILQCVLHKYCTELWPEYKSMVLKLLARKPPAKEFVKEVRKLNEKYFMPV